MKKKSIKMSTLFEEYGILEYINDKYRLCVEKGFKENITNPKNNFIIDKINEILKIKLENIGLTYKDQTIYNNGNQDKIMQIGYSYLTFDPKHSRTALGLCKFLYNIKEAN